MKRILIISYHFPPINNINARRFGGMVCHLPKFGWQPIILTTKTEGPLPVLVPEQNVLRFGENYDSKKKLVVSEEGYRGIPWFLKAPYFFYRNLKMEIASVDRFMFKWGRDILRNREIMEKIREKNPDLIVGTCYPPVAIWVARVIAKKLKKPWLADLQDPLSLWNNAKFPFVKFIDRLIDKFLISSAVGVITISSYLAAEMAKLYRKPVDIIYNGFDFVQRVPRRNYGGKKIIYYAGRFHDHRMPAINLFLEWLKKTKRKNICFILRSLGPLKSNEEIVSFVRENNFAERINILSPAPPEVIFREEERADVLLVFEDLLKQMNHSQGTLSGKLTELLSCRAPIVAVNRPDSEMGKILKKTGRGYLVSDSVQLDDALEKIFQGKGPKFDWQKVKKFSREAQTENFCRVLDKIYA